MLKFYNRVTINNFHLFLQTMQDLKSLLTNVKSEIQIPRPLECVVWSNRFRVSKQID